MLRLDSITCGYGSVEVVHELDLTVAKGQIVALIGANGAGKTSTLMAVAGHVDVKKGTILLDGNDITNTPTRHRVGLGIAIVPEGRRLFPDLTTLENLIIGGYSLKRKQAIERQADVFELFPILHERSSQLAGSLSGGEQQMLAIGRAMMANPRLLLIDELSLGLMPKMIDACYAAIAALKSRGLTILLIEQSTNRAMDVAEEVCVLESGRAVWRGTGSEARRSPELIEAYLGIKSDGNTDE